MIELVNYCSLRSDIATKMMSYLDFDTIIFCFRDFQKETLTETFQFFSKIGIKHFIFTHELDCDHATISLAKARNKALSKQIEACKPKSCRFYLVSCPVLYDGVTYQADLASIKFPRTEYLFTSLPMFVGDSWLPSDLNRLLYNQKLKPVFTRFERNLQTNSPELLNSISHIPSAIYALDAMFMASPDGFSVAEEFIGNKLSIFPCVSDHIYDYAGILKAYERLSKQIPQERYYTFCRALNYTKSLLLRWVLNSR